MQVKDIMTPDPICCEPQTSLIEVAQIMVKYDCGEVPVVENTANKTLVGVITDRDIVCRTLGKKLDPTAMSVSECMSSPVVSISRESELDECLTLMEEKLIRRIPVTDSNDAVCGIISLADITKYSSDENAGEVLREISTDIGASSNVL